MSANDRDTWTAALFRSFDDAERADRAFWLAITPIERLREVERLTEELAALRGLSPHELRLSRSIARIRRR
jgi:hypothetical protein